MAFTLKDIAIITETNIVYERVICYDAVSPTARRKDCIYHCYLQSLQNRNVEIMERGTLIGIWGEGKNKSLAAASLLSRIRHHRIVTDATDSKWRREFDIP